MVRNVQLRLTLKEEGTPNGLEIRAAKYLGLEDGTFKIRVLRKSITNWQFILMNLPLAMPLTLNTKMSRTQNQYIL